MPKKQLRFQVLLFITIISVSMSFSHSAIGRETPTASVQSPPTNPPASNSSALVFITPSNVTSAALSTGKLTFSVYLNHSTPISINLFSVSIQYNSKILKVDNVNSTNNILGSQASTLYYCVDGTNVLNPNAACLAGVDAPGVVTYSQSLQGVTSQSFSEGFLFNVTFNIVGSGLAQLHMLNVVIGNGTLSGIRTTSTDGFFANGYCGTVICRPPSVNITLSPAVFSVGRVGTLNATVLLRNPSDSVLNYTWFFGETTATSQGIITTFVPYVQHVYQNAGSYIAGVQLTDKYNVIWIATASVNVTRLYIALSASEPKVDPQQRVAPGTLVQISASISNLSTIPVTTTFSITVGGTLSLKNSTSVLLSPGGGEASMDAVWNTTGFTPQAYAITVIIPPYPNENTTAGNMASTYVILVSVPLSGLLSLGLLQTTGLGIIVLVAIGFVLSRFLKRPSYELEAI